MSLVSERLLSSLRHAVCSTVRKRFTFPFPELTITLAQKTQLKIKEVQIVQRKHNAVFQGNMGKVKKKIRNEIVHQTRLKA